MIFTISKSMGCYDAKISHPLYSCDYGSGHNQLFLECYFARLVLSSDITAKTDLDDVIITKAKAKRCLSQNQLKV